MTRAEQINWRHMTSSTFVWSFTRSQLLGHLWRGKSSFLIAKVHEIFWETNSKRLELLITLISRQKSVYVFKKIRVIYTSSKSFIFFTMNRRFIFSTIWSPITHTILKKKKRKTLKKREKITSSWIIQIIYKKTHFNSNWNQNKSYLTIYQEISHLKYYSMILFKSLPLRLCTLRDRTSQITCQKDIY